MILYLWKILVVLLFLEKHFIFKPGITRITCLSHYEVEQKYNPPKFKILSPWKNSNQEKINFHTNIKKNDNLLAESVKGDNIRDSFTENKVKELEPKIYKREYLYYPNVNSQRRIQLTHHNHEKESLNPNIHLDLGDPNIQVYELEPNQINEKYIRKIIDMGKGSKIPQCSKNEYETIEKWDYMTLIDLPELFQRPREKKQINYSDIIQKIKENSNSELVKSIRTRWRSKRRYKDDKLNVKTLSMPQMNSLPENLGINIAKSHDNQKYMKITKKERRSTNLNNFVNNIESPLTARILTSAPERIIEQYNNIPKQFEGNSIKEVSNLSAMRSFKSNITPSVLLVENESVPEQFIQVASLFPLQITQDELINDLTKNFKDVHSHLFNKVTKNKVTSEVNSEKEIRNQNNPVGYLYLQQIPFADRLYVQNSVNTKNKSNSIGNLEDVITIMINPKTLKHKILHAEYFKKSEEKKTPDTLIIDLVPMYANNESTLTTPDEKVSSTIQPSTSTTSTIQHYTSTTNTIQPSTISTIQPSTISTIQPSTISTIQPSTISTIQPSTSTTSTSPTISTNITSQGSTNSNQPVTESINMSILPLNYYSPEVKQQADNNSKANFYNDGDHLNDFTKLRYSRDLQSDNNDYSQFFECDMPLNGVVDSKIPVLQASKKELDAQIDRPIKKVSSEENYNNKNSVNSLQMCLTEIPLGGQNYNCHQTTLVFRNFKELNEGYKDNNEIRYSDLYKVNPKWIEECSNPPSLATMNLCNLSHVNLKDRKRDICALKRSKVISPIIIMYPKSDEEESKEDTKYFSSLSGDSESKDNSTAIKLSNKKVENKILESFINSIISNYSKELVTLAPKKSNNEDGEVLINILRDLVSRKGLDGLHLEGKVPIIVPQESIAQFKDSKDYEKLGPFSEDIIKSIFTENTIQLIKENKR